MANLLKRNIDFDQFVKLSTDNGGAIGYELKKYIDKTLDKDFETSFSGNLAKNMPHFIGLEQALDNYKNFELNPIYLNACFLQELIRYDYEYEEPYDNYYCINKTDFYNAFSNGYMIYTLYSIDELHNFLDNGNFNSVFDTMLRLKYAFFNIKATKETKIYLDSFINYQYSFLKDDELGEHNELGDYYSNPTSSDERTKKTCDLWLFDIYWPLRYSIDFEVKKANIKYRGWGDETAEISSAVSFRKYGLRILDAMSKVVYDGLYHRKNPKNQCIKPSERLIASELMQIKPSILEKELNDLASTDTVDFTLSNLDTDDSFLGLIHGLYMAGKEWRKF